MYVTVKTTLDIVPDKGGWLVQVITKSRSEQPPGSVFHPRDEKEKNDCDFLGPSWCNIKLDPE